MKRILLILICSLMFSFTTARAYERTDSIHPALPPVTIRVTDAGENGGMLRENLLRVQIAAQDGSFEQELVWQSAETSAHDGAAALAFWN